MTDQARAALTDPEWDYLVGTFLGDPPAVCTRWAAARVEAGRAGMDGLDPDLALAALDYRASGLAASRAIQARGYVKVPGPSAAGRWAACGETHNVYARAGLSEGERLEAVGRVLAELRGSRPLPKPPEVAPVERVPRGVDERADAAARRRGFTLAGLAEPEDLDPRHVVAPLQPDRPYYVAFRAVDPSDPRVVVADGLTLERAMRRGLELIDVLAAREADAAPVRRAS